MSIYGHIYYHSGHLFPWIHPHLSPTPQSQKQSTSILPSSIRRILPGGGSVNTTSSFSPCLFSVSPPTPLSATTTTTTTATKFQHTLRVKLAYHLHLHISKMSSSSYLPPGWTEARLKAATVDDLREIPEDVSLSPPLPSKNSFFFWRYTQLDPFHGASLTF